MKVTQTGSFVRLIEVNDITVLAGSIYDSPTPVKTNDYAKYTIKVIETSTVSHTFSVGSRFEMNGVYAGGVLVNSTTYLGSAIEKSMETDEIKLRINNTDTVDHVYDGTLWGVKS